MLNEPLEPWEARRLVRQILEDRKKMKCFECGGPMISQRVRYRDYECGLPNVTLVGVEVRTCKRCGEKEVAIPRIEDLHRTIARAVVNKPGRLTGAEIRFLRKYMGWSGDDFSRHFGVKPETVSRWEHERENMAPTAERLLRLGVAHYKQVDEYPVERLEEIGQGVPKPLRLKIQHCKEEWKAATA